jgi:hypothetical protein
MFVVLCFQQFLLAVYCMQQVSRLEGAAKSSDKELGKLRKEIEKAEEGVAQVGGSACLLITVNIMFVTWGLERLLSVGCLRVL